MFHQLGGWYTPLTLVGALVGVMIAALVAGGPARADQDDERLDPLFNELKEAESAAAARPIEQAIWGIWETTDDAQDQALMQRGIDAMAARDFATALDQFDRLVERAPDFAEAWNRRATVYYLIGDFEASVRDIQRTLSLEPRHFGALSGLGMIYDAINKPAAAIKSFEAALELNPYLAGPKARIEALRPRLHEGET